MQLPDSPLNILKALSKAESKIEKLSLILSDEDDQASTTGKTIKISKNILDSTSPDAHLYLICHEAGHYLAGHNRRSSRLVCYATFGIALFTLTTGVIAAGAILIAAAAFVTMTTYNQQWVMSAEYEADNKGFRLAERISTGAYKRGMREVSDFHIHRDSTKYPPEELSKEIERRKKHLNLKINKLDALQ